jgi:hypothetical protein
MSGTGSRASRTSSRLWSGSSEIEEIGEDLAHLVQHLRAHVVDRFSEPVSMRSTIPTTVFGGSSVTRRRQLPEPSAVPTSFVPSIVTTEHTTVRSPASQLSGIGNMKFTSSSDSS